VRWSRNSSCRSGLRCSPLENEPDQNYIQHQCSTTPNSFVGAHLGIFGILLISHALRTSAFLCSDIFAIDIRLGIRRPLLSIFAIPPRSYATHQFTDSLSFSSFDRPQPNLAKSQVEPFVPFLGSTLLQSNSTRENILYTTVGTDPY
jgi:hypothetical protein